MKTYFNIFFLLLLLLLAGCNQKVNKARNLVDRGIMYAEAEQYDKAIELYNRAIKIYPQSEEAYLQLALLYDENLKDKKKAIQTYKDYLKVAVNEVNKKKVRKWILEAENQISGEQIAKLDDKNSAAQQDDQSESKTIRSQQIETLKRQIAEKFEKKIDELKNEIFDVQNQCAKLSNENIALRANDKNRQIAGLLDTIASNEQTIAVLQAKIEADKREANAAVQAQQTLQSIITNLQAKLSAEGYESSPDIFSSNMFLISEIQKMKNIINEIKSEKSQIELQFAELKIKYSQLTNTSAGITDKPTVPLTPELLQEFENAKKQIVEYRRRENFNRQEREGFTATIKKLRELLDATNKRLAAEKQKNNVSSDAVAEISQLKKDLKSLNASIKYREKQLYERTLQLKKLQQSYQTLRKQYLDEVRKREKISNVITDIQKEVSNKPAPIRKTTALRKYTVKAGDSLMKISSKVYGDKNRWREIYRANKEMLDRERKLKVGQTLIIP